MTLQPQRGFFFMRNDITQQLENINIKSLLKINNYTLLFTVQKQINDVIITPKRIITQRLL